MKPGCPRLIIGVIIKLTEFDALVNLGESRILGNLDKPRGIRGVSPLCVLKFRTHP